MSRKPSDPVEGQPGTYTLPADFRRQGTVSVEFRQGDMLQLRWNATQIDKTGTEWFIYDLQPCHINEWRKLWTTDWTKTAPASGAKGGEP